MDAVRSLLLWALLASACAEARTDRDAGTRDAGTDAPIAQLDAPDAGLVINELNVADTDWIELFNPRSSAFDLSGFSISDTDPDGTLRTDHIVAFPSGVIIQPSSYFVIVRAQPATAGLQVGAACAVSGVTRCMQIEWGISAMDGGGIVLLASNGDVAAQLEYPGDSVGAGETWCRLPNGSGQPAACMPTPEATNAAAP